MSISRWGRKLFPKRNLLNISSNYNCNSFCISKHFSEIVLARNSCSASLPLIADLVRPATRPRLSSENSGLPGQKAISHTIFSKFQDGRINSFWVVPDAEWEHTKAVLKLNVGHQAALPILHSIVVPRKRLFLQGFLVIPTFLPWNHLSFSFWVFFSRLLFACCYRKVCVNRFVSASNSINRLIVILMRAEKY